MSISNNNNDQSEIPLELSKALEESGTIHKFVIDPNDKYVKLRLNSLVNPPVAIDASTEVIKKPDGWKKFINGFSNDLRLQKLANEYHVLIISTINENGDLIRRIARSNNNNDFATNSSQKQQNNQQEQQQNDTSDINDLTKSINAEKEKNIEKVSISQAIRMNSGRVQIIGTITGITPLSKMISKTQLYCDKCAVYSECSFNPIPVANIKDIKEKCNICDRLIRTYHIKPLDHKNSVLIELQDANTFDDLDRLPVLLFDNDTIDISKKIGENAEIIGEIKIVENSFKYYPYLYCESIKYLNKENYELTDEDKERIIQFNEKYKNTEGGTIHALVEIFDPSIVDCDVEKEGILYVTVNTSPKIGDKSEHIDILLIGPPGLAKTTLLERGTELVPGSNKVGGQYATGKSFTAIVEKTDSNTFLRLGSIPRSSDAICGINELSKLTNQDLEKLYDVMAGRMFDFEKHGIKANIKTPTAIIATANPADSDSWISNEKVNWNELPGLAPLKDRWGLIFVLRKRSKEENDKFTDKWSEVQGKKEAGELPDNTEFLIKYLQYAKKIEPILSDEARFMLKEFYKTVNATGFGSPRVLNTLNNLAKAVARLKLKNIVDEEDAKKAQEFYNIMLQNFQKSVVYSESPKIIAYKKGIEIIKKFENFGIELEHIFETICDEDKQLATYFGYDKGKTLEIKYNHKTRDVKELLLNHSNVKIIQEKPIVLKWMERYSDNQNNSTSDVSDKEKYLDPEKNKKNNFSESGSKSMSHTSLSKEEEQEESEKGVQLTPGGRVYRVTDEWYEELNNGET